MKNIKISISPQSKNEFTSDIVVVFCWQDEDGEVQFDESFLFLKNRIAGLEDFEGKKDQVLMLFAEQNWPHAYVGCRRAVVIGLGKPGSTGYAPEELRLAAGAAAQQIKKSKCSSVTVVVPQLEGQKEKLVVELLCEGLILGSYSFAKYKTKKKEDLFTGPQQIEFAGCAKKKSCRQSAERGYNNALAACVARDMANEPGNYWTPAEFAEYGRQLAKEGNLKCTVLNKASLKKLGMGGILAVNQGSHEEPKCVIVEYRTTEKNADTILLVGKGLTFDSGGISLKPAAGMMDMKYDMCGGAAVLATMAAMSKQRPGVNVVAIVPATDNMSGGGALKPGDVITHYGGTTSEIDNTDAEGRLILADALAYGIEKYNPSCVIDLATLTGAVIIALGHHHCGVMSNSDTLVERLRHAGGYCGEPNWRLPLGDDYVKQLKSEVADLKNTGGRPGGSITAAEYLHQFVGETPWAHLDIAGTAWDFTEKSYIPKGPSGFGVRTLIKLISDWQPFDK